MAIINASETLDTYPAIQIASLIASDELVRFAMLIAIVQSDIHNQQQKQCDNLSSQHLIIRNIIIQSNRLLLIMNQEKVQFFHSESSFGSESDLSESRYHDFTNQLIAESDNIFLTLKHQLLPNENLLHQDKIKHAITRAQIIQKDTIPQHLAYLNKINAPEYSKEQVSVSHEKLGKLMTDYEKLKDGVITYKQFYNTYGKQYGFQQGAFGKKSNLSLNILNEAEIQPQYIQINYNTEKLKLKATPRVFMSAVTNNNEKQNSNFREQIYQLKRALEENRKKYEVELINQKINCERRLQNYMRSETSPGPQVTTLKQSLNETSQRLSKLLQQNKSLLLTIQEQKKVIQTLKSDNTSLQEQIELLRKTESSILEQQNLNNKSYASEMNHNEDRRGEKRMKNLKQQNQLLKNQLKTQRQRFYRLQTDLTEEEKRELDRNRKNMEKTKVQLQELYNSFDKQRVEVIQLNHSQKSYIKLCESLKKQNEELKRQIDKFNKTQESVPIKVSLPVMHEKSLQLSRNMGKTKIMDYEGDGIQGYPYYQILGKEFKIRFKRACLREKQLLYKSNGLQVGIITNFEKPNKINMLIHITNYSEKKFEKVKARIMNANENKIAGQTFESEILSSNQQVKMPISLTINQYPIGPLILLLQYISTNKQDLRILLPAHVFKIMEVEERDEDMVNSTKISIVTERKIAKDLNDIKQYLKGSDISGGAIRVSLFNQHTHTILNMDLIQTKDGIDILYEHKEGSRQITEYFIKTFVFLLMK